jgi:hypothetical protein
MKNEARSDLASDLFDVRRRTWVGFECYYEAAPALLRRLVTEGVSPEEIGRRMKVPGSRPYYLQLFLLMSNYLGSRQERVLQNGTAPERQSEEAFEDLRTLVEFFARTTAAYRNDGDLMPIAPDENQCVLERSWLAKVVDLLGPTDDLAAITSMSAMLSLYLFILHGEQRDGQFDHGPYPGPEGTQVIVREFNDLGNTYMPWAGPRTEIPYSNVCVAYACSDVAMRFTIFGGAVTDPSEIGCRVKAVAAFTRVGDELHPLDAEDMAALAAAAKREQMEIYRRVVAWEPVERWRYGLYLYANSLIPFFTIVGRGQLAGEITAQFEEIGGRVAHELDGDAPLPLLFGYYSRRPEGAIFAPVDRR